MVQPYAPSNFLGAHAVLTYGHLTCTTKQMNMLRCVLKEAKYEKQKPRISYIPVLKAVTIYSIQKL